MSKTNIRRIFCILVISTLSDAMELVSLKSQQKKNDFQIHCIQDIPKLSLKDIRPCCNILPEKERNKLLISLANSLTFNIALLEEDARLHILTFLLDHDEKSAQLFNTTPLWYAHQFYQDLHKQLQYAPGLQQHAGFLFRLPKNKQEQFIKVASTQPTFLTEWIDNSTIFINNKQRKKLEQDNEEIKEKVSTDTIIRLFTKQAAREHGWMNWGLFCAWAATTILPIALVFDKIHDNSLLHARMGSYNLTNNTYDKSFEVLSKNCHVEYGKLICHERTSVMDVIQFGTYFYALALFTLTISKIYFERKTLRECPIIKI